MEIRIHTAGVAQGNPRPGGYAAVMWLFGDPVVIHGNSAATDEEEMGLRAVVEGITHVWNIFGNETQEMSIEIHSSSPSVMDAARAAVQTPGGNKEKIRQELAQVTENVRVSFVHDQHEENRHAQRIADHWAEEAAQERELEKTQTYIIPPVWEGPYAEPERALKQAATAGDNLPF